MKKVAKWGLIVLGTLTVIGLIIPKNKAKEKGNKVGNSIAAKKYTTDPAAFNNDLVALAKELDLSTEKVEDMGYYVGYQKKAGKDLTTMTYGDIVAIATEFRIEREKAAAEKEEKWVTVATLKGNGRKQSGSFHLSGGETKLVYKYRSEDEDMGMFTAYVEKEGHDLNSQGGFPAVMSSAGKENTESFITKSEGDYYMLVDGVGNYTVHVQEKM